MCELIKPPVLRRARRRHRCSGCGHAILRGWDYYVSVNRSDGRLYSWTEHVPCRAEAEIAFATGCFTHLPEGWLLEEDWSGERGATVSEMVRLGVAAAGRIA